MKKTEVLYLLVLETVKAGTAITMTYTNSWPLTGNKTARPTFHHWMSDCVKSFKEDTEQELFYIKHSNIIES